MSLIGLAWTVKFLWAPLVDAWRGHRWWIAGANWGMAGVLVALALNPQALGQGATWPWVLLTAFTVLSATNDIATDGYTIELLQKGNTASPMACALAFTAMGMLAAGGLLVVAGAMGEAGQPSWSAAYGMGAVLMLVNGMAVLLAPRQSAAPAKVEASAREWQALREQPLWLLALALGADRPAVAGAGPLAKWLQWEGPVALQQHPGGSGGRYRWA